MGAASSRAVLCFCTGKDMCTAFVTYTSTTAASAGIQGCCVGSDDAAPMEWRRAGTSVKLASALAA